MHLYIRSDASTPYAGGLLTFLYFHEWSVAIEYGGESRVSSPFTLFVVGEVDGRLLSYYLYFTPVLQ